MEQRIIDANALRERLLVLRCNITDVQCISDIFDICLTEVSNAPTINTYTEEEVQEIRRKVARQFISNKRPKGEWEDMSWFYHKPMYKCTRCNQIFEIGYYSYCPQCGSDMRGKTYEND